jgi:hypothetical protein
MSFMDLLDSQKIIGKVNVKVVEKRYVNKKMKLPIFVKNYLYYAKFEEFSFLNRMEMDKKSNFLIKFFVPRQIG